MTCAMCHHEFWWVCLEQTSQHRHKTDFVADPIILLFYWPNIIFFLISTIVKLGFQFKSFGEIAMFCGYYLSVFLYSFFNGFFLLLTFANLGFLFNSYNANMFRNDFCNWLKRYFGFVLMTIIVWGFQIVLVQQAIQHKSFFRDMIFLYLIALGLAIIIGCAALILKCMFSIFSSKNLNYSSFYDDNVPDNMPNPQTVIEVEAAQRNAAIRQNFENAL